MTDELQETPPQREGRHWGNVAAGFSAACALAVSVYTAVLQRQQVKAQVWPILSWGLAGSDHRSGDAGAADEPDFSFSFNLRNDGVGPAVVRTMEVTVDGHPVRQWSEVVRVIVPGPQGEKPSWGARYTVVHGRVIAAGEKVEVFAPNGDIVPRRFFEDYERVAVKLCYCSVLDDCWTVRAQGLKERPEPEHVSSCLPPAIPFEE